MAIRRYQLWGHEPWTPRDTDRYHDGGYNGVSLWPESGNRTRLDFVRDLQGLRCIEVHGGPVTDDVAVFDVPTLEHLTLLTRCRKPLRLACLPLLRTVVVRARPGLESVASLPELTQLCVVRWQGSDLTFLGEQPKLQLLRLEGWRRPRSRLDGIERAPNLDDLMALDVRIESIEPLRELANLRSIQLTGVPGMEDGEPWDLTALTGKPRLVDFRAPSQGSVRSLAPLLRLPALTGVGIGATVLDGDLTPYLDLPPHVNVVVFKWDARPHYSHTPEEINRLRDAMRAAADEHPS